MAKKTRKQGRWQKMVREVSRFFPESRNPVQKALILETVEELKKSGELTPELKRRGREKGKNIQVGIPFELNSKDKKRMAYNRAEDLFLSQGRNRYEGRGFKKKMRQAFERRARIVKNAEAQQKHPENN